MIEVVYTTRITMDIQDTENISVDETRYKGINNNKIIIYQFFFCFRQKKSSKLFKSLCFLYCQE